MFEFKFNLKELNHLKILGNEDEEDGENTTDESSIFDSIPSSQTFNETHEEIFDKSESYRPTNFYENLPLFSSSILRNKKYRFSGVPRNNACISGSASTLTKGKECPEYNGLENSHTLGVDIDYSTLNNEAKRNAFCQSAESGYDDSEQMPIIIESKEYTQENLASTSFSSTSSSVDADFSNISTSTLKPKTRITKSAKARAEFNPAAARHRLSFLQPVNPMIKIKIYLTVKDQDEEVMAVKVPKDKLHGLNQLLNIIRGKITNLHSDLDENDIRLQLLFKQENIRPIPLLSQSGETLNGSNFNTFDKTSLIMDYLSGREKLYIKALV